MAGSPGSAPAPIAAPRRGRCVVTTTTPATASATPSSCATLGRSPPAIPQRKGTNALVAVIGATMLMVPIASAL